MFRRVSIIATAVLLVTVVFVAMLVIIMRLNNDGNQGNPLRRDVGQLRTNVAEAEANQRTLPARGLISP